MKSQLLLDRRSFLTASAGAALAPLAALAQRDWSGQNPVRYPDADHGFVHDPERDVHRPEEAAMAWSKTITWIS